MRLSYYSFPLFFELFSWSIRVTQRLLYVGGVSFSWSTTAAASFGLFTGCTREKCRS